MVRWKYLRLFGLTLLDHPIITPHFVRCDSGGTCDQTGVEDIDQQCWSIEAVTYRFRGSEFILEPRRFKYLQATHLETEISHIKLRNLDVLLRVLHQTS